jgi:hypothetical protein
MQHSFLYFPLAVSLTIPALGAPAKPAPKKPAPKKPVVVLVKAVPPKPAEDPLLLSNGKEVVIVDRLAPEVTTVVLFYVPTDDGQLDLMETLRKRIEADRRVRLKLVKLTAVDAPVAKQYEVTELPAAFVYDRNKNLLGKATTFTAIGDLVGKGVKTARLKWVDEADPKAAEVYKLFGGGARGVPEIMKTMSLQPGIMEGIHGLSRYHFSDGYLDRRTHEVIASYVSALNKCKY